MGLVSSPILQPVDFELTVIVAGVLFEEGTIRKTVRAVDFNALGEYEVRFVKPASATGSICHITEAYQGRVSLGSHQQ